MTKQIQNEKGFSYLEIMISLIIIGVVIGPVGSAMVSATKTQIKAKITYEATKGAEALMEKVKMGLDGAIVRRLEEATLEHSNQVLLEGNPSEGSSYPELGKMDLISALSIDPSLYQMKLEEETQGLIYDVAIWNANQLIEGTTHFSFSNPDDKNSDGQSSYNESLAEQSLQTIYLDEAEIRLQSEPMSIAYEEALKSEETMHLSYTIKNKEENKDLMTFVESQKVEGDDQEEFVGTAVLEVTEGTKLDEESLVFTKKTYSGMKSDNQAAFTLSGKNEENVDKKDGVLTYYIGNTTSKVFNESEKPNQNESSTKELVIYLDTSKLSNTTQNTMTIRFINQSGYPVIIKWIGKTNNSGQEMTIMTDARNGSIVIEKNNNFGVMGNYVIGIVVRDKANSERIVKKMIDFYSYIKE